ncbi:MAG: hypothetical protein EZS26_003538 [Candidatus Ordinivivax streblomastigis]|uniref:Uncharacterized protein n=1 Tax=Candidatus Ordinivivax streblomastigis TaxID=2540710 RepID=A0A5M8NY69_9BACT|nr:MAG: hypothetical protein EZS26_003538 [Candidatus Ordinivivax streblomastigis]
MKDVVVGAGSARPYPQFNKAGEPRPYIKIFPVI